MRRPAKRQAWLAAGAVLFLAGLAVAAYSAAFELDLDEAVALLLGLLVVALFKRR